jgi:6-phosphogluconate dehydrogenase
MGTIITMATLPSRTEARRAVEKLDITFTGSGVSGGGEGAPARA